MVTSRVKFGKMGLFTLSHLLNLRLKLLVCYPGLYRTGKKHPEYKHQIPYSRTEARQSLTRPLESWQGCVCVCVTSTKQEF